MAASNVLTDKSARFSCHEIVNHSIIVLITVTVSQTSCCYFLFYALFLFGLCALHANFSHSFQRFFSVFRFLLRVRHVRFDLL